MLVVFALLVRFIFLRKKMRSIFILTLLSSVFITAHAQDNDIRGGTCEQTKMQYDHYCTKKGDPTKDDIYSTANIACNNAKRNMAAACDGSSEEDMPYGFDRNGTPVTDPI
jgi:hypothetical protein